MLCILIDGLAFEAYRITETRLIVALCSIIGFWFVSERSIEAHSHTFRLILRFRYEFTCFDRYSKHDCVEAYSETSQNEKIFFILDIVIKIRKNNVTSVMEYNSITGSNSFLNFAPLKASIATQSYISLLGLLMDVSLTVIPIVSTNGSIVSISNNRL